MFETTPIAGARRAFRCAAGALAGTMLALFATQAAALDEPLQDAVELEALAATFAAARASVVAGTGPAPEIVVGRIDPRLRLPACAELEPFVPEGRSLLGRTMIGIRCAKPVAWRVYVPVEVRAAGAPSPDPAPAAAAAPPPRRVAAAEEPPSPRRPTPRLEPVIAAGQAVRVQVRGAGFTVQGEGRALAAAAPGQSVGVRMPGGQVLTGIARQAGVVELVL